MNQFTDEWFKWHESETFFFFYVLKLILLSESYLINKSTVNFAPIYFAIDFTFESSLFSDVKLKIAIESRID